MKRWQGCLAGVLGVFWLCGILTTVGAQTAPRLHIDHKGFTQPQRQGQAVVIEATITSPAGIRKAEVFCRAVGAREFTALLMESGGGELYRAVVPDWMTAGSGVEYYITASDQAGRSTSQGFVGFPLTVRLLPARQFSQEERVKELDAALEILRKNRETPPTPSGNYQSPQPDRYR